MLYEYSPWFFGGGVSDIIDHPIVFLLLILKFPIDDKHDSDSQKVHLPVCDLPLYNK